MMKLLTWMAPARRRPLGALVTRALLALAFCGPVSAIHAAVASAQLDAGQPQRAAPASARNNVNRDGTIGPFATMRRAQEEADRYRALGWRAVAFHNGDGYYVRVSR